MKTKILSTRYKRFKSRKRKQYLVSCPHCKKEKWVLAQNFDKQKSCGCLVVRNTTHNMSKTRQYNTWKNIIQRCTNPNHTTYRYYGGRGITVDKNWLSFENFWRDMKDGYDKNLTIDRIDPNGNYEKGNCRWSTKLEQVLNRRNVKV